VSLSLNALTGCIYALAAYGYPPFVKGTGLGAAGAVGRIGAITSSYAAVEVLAISSRAFFWFIAVTALISMGCLMTIRRHIPRDEAFSRADVAR
jgi:AAHS family 4-hydroxybenzoate transporter-like MFS transporter